MVDVGQRNVEIARKAYAAFETGDIEAVNAALADDIVWHAGGRSSLAGDYRGKPAVMEFFGKFLQTVESNHTDVHDILANDQHTIVVGTVSQARKGRKFEARFVDVIHPDPDGRAKEFWRFFEDQAAADQFLAD